MARTGKMPPSRAQKCADAIKLLNEAERLLRSVNLTSVRKPVRPAFRQAREDIATARHTVVAAMQADVPELPLPMQRTVA